MKLNRALRPLINQRDILSIAHTNIVNSLRSTLNALTAAETGSIISNQKNRELTPILFEFASRLKAQDIEDIQDPELRSELEALQIELKVSRGRRRIMKSVMVAVIVGSGIDWARKDDLRELVLDDEE